MLRNYAFTRFVISFLVMGRAVTARAADSAAPSYPDWAAAVVPAYPHVLPSSGPITPNLYGSQRPTTCRRWLRGTNRACTAHGRKAREEIPGL
jgi:hypothetical protein